MLHIHKRGKSEGARACRLNLGTFKQRYQFSRIVSHFMRFRASLIRLPAFDISVESTRMYVSMCVGVWMCAYTRIYVRMYVREGERRNSERGGVVVIDILVVSLIH